MPSMWASKPVIIALKYCHNQVSNDLNYKEEHRISVK